MEATTKTISSYTLRMLDGSGVEQTVEAESDEAAKEAARDWAREGDWDTTSTIWVSVRVLRLVPRHRIGQGNCDVCDDQDVKLYAHPTATQAVCEDCYAALNADEVEVGDVMVEIDPVAPNCADGSRDGHDWQSPIEIVGGVKENPGVWGHGGGVMIHAVCMRCGCARITDTWAQDRATGRQGLTSVSFDREKYYEVLEREIARAPVERGPKARSETRDDPSRRRAPSARRGGWRRR